MAQSGKNDADKSLSHQDTLSTVHVRKRSLLRESTHGMLSEDAISINDAKLIEGTQSSQSEPYCTLEIEQLKPTYISQRTSKTESSALESIRVINKPTSIWKQFVHDIRSPSGGFLGKCDTCGRDKKHMFISSRFKSISARTLLFIRFISFLFVGMIETIVLIRRILSNFISVHFLYLTSISSFFTALYFLFLIFISTYHFSTVILWNFKKKSAEKDELEQEYSNTGFLNLTEYYRRLEDSDYSIPGQDCLFVENVLPSGRFLHSWYNNPLAIETEEKLQCDAVLSAKYRLSLFETIFLYIQCMALSTSLVVGIGYWFVLVPTGAENPYDQPILTVFRHSLFQVLLLTNFLISNIPLFIHHLFLTANIYILYVVALALWNYYGFDIGKGVGVVYSLINFKKIPLISAIVLIAHFVMGILIHVVLYFVTIKSSMVMHPSPEFSCSIVDMPLPDEAASAISSNAENSA